MPTPLSRADAMLEGQYARLTAIIASDAPPELKSLARHYLAKVQQWQAEPDAMRDLALGLMGGNGDAPSIDDVCWRAEFFARRAGSDAQDRKVAA